MMLKNIRESKIWETKLKVKKLEGGVGGQKLLELCDLIYEYSLKTKNMNSISL
jgi:hypothetical protein